MKADEVVALIQSQIVSGVLTAGDRLPTHRDMAWDLKCSVGTVTRAYGDLERRGIIYGHVGRGTFVASQTGGVQSPLASFDKGTRQFAVDIDLSLNRFHHPENTIDFSNALRALADRSPQSGYGDYIDTRGRNSDIQVAVRWLKSLIGEVKPANVMVTHGAQSGLYLAMKALAKYGDTIATESFGYPGIKAAAQEIGLKLHAVEMDEYGMIPEAFRMAVRRARVKLLVTVPTNHNPTGTTLPLQRRLEIVKIAQAADIPIIEDGVYAPFQEIEVPSYYEIDPENNVFLTSFSKVFSPGLRVGYIVAPDGMIPRLVSSMKAINWTTSAVTLDLIAQLLEVGTIASHRDDLIAEGQIRFKIAKQILSPWMTEGQLTQAQFLPHLWLRLPRSSTPSEIIERARDAGIALIGGDRFAMSRQLDDYFIRVCLMAVPARASLVDALRILGGLLSQEDMQSLIS